MGYQLWWFTEAAFVSRSVPGLGGPANFSAGGRYFQTIAELYQRWMYMLASLGGLCLNCRSG